MFTSEIMPNKEKVDPSSFTSQAKQILWKGLIITLNCGYEAVTTVGVFVVSGLALRIFFPFMGAPFLGISVSLLVTRVVVKILNVYNNELLKTIKTQAILLSKKYSKLELITFVFAIGISAFSPALGFALAAVTGVYGGILIEVRLAEKRQKMPNQYEIGSFSESKEKFIIE